MRILENDQTAVPSTAAIAKRVGLSPAYFSRSFAAQVGEGSAAYGRRIRLDHSINRLRYDPASIGEVARDFGYESQAAFTRAFNEQFGASPRDHMARLAAAPFMAPPPLPGPVRLVQRRPTPLAARRFLGEDYARSWQLFVDELPDSLRRDAVYIGLAYDDPRITDERHLRFDCCVVLASGAWRPAMARQGLDAIELPGGLHGEVDAAGNVEDLRGYFASLFAEWLPTRPALVPEGDPLPIFFDGVPIGVPVCGQVAIRVRERLAPPRPNAALLQPEPDNRKL